MHDASRDTPDASGDVAAPIRPFDLDSRAAQTIAFTGENSDFRRLVTRGALLELVTAGFYRFWLATNMRRYLWSNTIIGGDALEYLGTGRELLFGFFFAIAILAPVYLAYFLVGLEAERHKAFASAPLLLFFFAFGQFAIYRAHRYRLHRTFWRGLQFGMSGSGFAYAARALAWVIAVVLTLGLALPWAQSALERYKMRHTFYGDLNGAFVGKGGAFFKRAWWIWASALIYPVVVGLGVLWLRPTKTPAGDGSGRLIDNGAGAAALFVIAAVAVALFIGPKLYASFKAAQWRWWLEGLRIGDVRVTADLSSTTLLLNYLKAAGLGLLVLIAGGLAMALAAYLSSKAGWAPNKLTGAPSIPFLLSLSIPYLATFLTIGVIMRIYLTQRIWKIVVSSLEVHDLQTAEDVAARVGAANAIGEGLADSLDVVGF